VHGTPDQIQEEQTAFTEPHHCGLIALKLKAGCAKLLTSLGIEYVGFRFGDVAPEQRDVFIDNLPRRDVFLQARKRLSSSYNEFISL